MRRLALVFLALTPVLASAADPADQQRQADNSPIESNVPSSYCGIYSLKYAASALGRDVSFHELLKPEYISSREGSSLDDLIQAASNLRLRAEPLGRMTCAMLHHVRCPVILHVKSDPRETKYNHWILFAGIESGKARIYDGVRPVELLDFADLATRWDGVGLLVADSPVSTSFLWLVIAAQFVFYAGACAGAFALLVLVQRRWASKPSGRVWTGGWPGCIHELVALILLSLALGVGFRWVHAEGFLSYSPAVAFGLPHEW